MVLHCFYYSSCQFRRTWAVVRYYRDFLTYVARYFSCYVEVPCHVGKEIPVVPYYRPGSPELAAAVVEAMKDHNSILLTNHGQVVCGKDFNQVMERATFFEMACRIIVQSGGDYSVLTPEEIDDLEIYVLGKKTK